MTLTQTDFEKLIENLHKEQTEPPYLDCKEELPLDEPGDKASFIRDVAALANNVRESYLVIGIQNKTWEEIGITKESPLLDPDQTQARMNQILENKLDPQLSIRYQVFSFREKNIGVVSVLGKEAPYLIGISESTYGGNKTKGNKCNIFRGAVYFRHGDTTAIVNRQSKILSILNQINTTDTLRESSSKFEEYLTKNGYKEIESPDFGHNPISQGLVEKVWNAEQVKNTYVRARSWVSIIIYPLCENYQINPSELGENLVQHVRLSNRDSWFQTLPRPVLDMITSATTNPRGIISKWSGNSDIEPNQHFQIINISSSGILNLSATYPLFYQNRGIRFFSFVTIIGYLWQLIYLSRRIVNINNCECNSKIILNLIGAKGTVLANLAKGQEKQWIDVFHWMYNSDPRNINQETNIQISREIELAKAQDNQIEDFVRDIAEELGHYYNQPKPRCFTPDTDEFPIHQYLQNVNW